MSIVLSILQILGIILLCVLGIILLAILLILLAPFTYCVEGDIHEAKWVKARVSWLLHLIRGRFTYEDDLLYAEMVLFWKKITFSYEFSKSEDGPADVTEEKEEATTKKPDKLKVMVAKAKELYPRIKQLIQDDRNQQAVKHLKEELFYLVKILLPKKSKVNASFSTGSPDTTGQLCGVMALFPIIYQKNWTLWPDFVREEAFFEGYFWGKGRLYAVQLVGILLRILFDKNCRRMYTMIDRLLKIMKRKPN